MARNRFIKTCQAVVLGLFLPTMALAQDATLSGSYASAGILPGGTVDIVFGLYSSEVANSSLSNGGFTYVVPANFTITGTTGSQFCQSNMSVNDQTLTVTDISLPISWTCSLTLHLQADMTEASYDLAPATLTYNGSGTFEMAPGQNPTLTVTQVPTITQMSPTGVPLEGGVPVVITGTRFYNVQGITVDGTSVSYTVDSPTQITLSTPSMAKGQKQVVITTAVGANLASSSSLLTYLPPIPTLTEWAMIGLAMVLAGFGALRLRRRQAA